MNWRDATIDWEIRQVVVPYAREDPGNRPRRPAAIYCQFCMVNHSPLVWHPDGLFCPWHLPKDGA